VCKYVCMCVYVCACIMYVCMFLPPSLLPSPGLPSLPSLPLHFPLSPPPNVPFLPLPSLPSLSPSPSPFRQAATAMRARTALLLAVSVGTLVFLGHVREISGRVLSAKASGDAKAGGKLGTTQHVVNGLHQLERARPESLLATNSVAHELRGDGPVGCAGRPRHTWDTQGGRFADLRANLQSSWKATLMIPPPLPLSLPHPKQGLWVGTSRGL